MDCGSLLPRLTPYPPFKRDFSVDTASQPPLSFNSKAFEIRKFAP